MSAQNTDVVRLLQFCLALLLRGHFSVTREVVSGGASAIKKPGHFEVRKSSSHHPDALFSSKKLTTFFSCRPQNTGRQRRFTIKIMQG